jgi:hypothetical protein
MQPILENDEEVHGKGISDYQSRKRKTDCAHRLKQRIDAHIAWLATEEGKKWKERQLMTIEDNLSVEWNALYLYTTWYDEQNNKGYFVDSDDDTVINFGKKHKGKRFREVYDCDKDYVHWIKKLKRDDEAVKRNPEFTKFVDYIKAVSFFE